MNILYTSDGECSTFMTLEQLIGNLNMTNGWKFGHNETDMRDDLNSRGWYEGLHDCGQYLVLNLAKFGLDGNRQAA